MLRRFTLKLFIVGLPIVCIVLYLELRLSSMNTQYLTKRVFLERQLQKLEVLILGSSNTYYGIDPEYFDRPGFNMAILAQSMYYDKAVTLKYLNRMPNLKVVILTANLFTLGNDHTTFSQNWRMYFYRQYFQLQLESTADQPFDWKYILEPKNFSKLALYGGQIFDLWNADFSNKIDLIPNHNGWYDAGDEIGDLSKEVGPNAAHAHSVTNAGLYSKHLSYWNELIERLKSRGIVSVIVVLPVHTSYSSNIDPAVYAHFEKTLVDFAKSKNVKFANYLRDPRFELKDFTTMVDHLNGRGAEKFSKILNLEILRPLDARLSRTE